MTTWTRWCGIWNKKRDSTKIEVRGPLSCFGFILANHMTFGKSLDNFGLQIFLKIN